MWPGEKNGAPVYNAPCHHPVRPQKIPEGLEFINLAISAEPMDAIYYYNRGNIRRAMKEFPKSYRGLAARPLPIAPNLPRLSSTGAIFYQQHRQKEGLRDLEEACRLGQCERLESFREMGRCLTGIWE